MNEAAEFQAALEAALKTKGPEDQPARSQNYNAEVEYQQPPRGETNGKSSRKEDPLHASAIVMFNSERDSSALFLSLFYSLKSQGSASFVAAFEQAVSQCDEQVNAMKFNVDKSQSASVANSCGVTSFPEIKIFVNGREVDSIIGPNVGELKEKVGRWASEVGFSYARGGMQPQGGSENQRGGGGFRENAPSGGSSRGNVGGRGHAPSGGGSEGNDALDQNPYKLPWSC